MQGEKNTKSFKALIMKNSESLEEVVLMESVLRNAIGVRFEEGVALVLNWKRLGEGRVDCFGVVIGYDGCMFLKIMKNWKATRMAPGLLKKRVTRDEFIEILGG